MKDKIEAILPNHTLIFSESPDLYIVDYTDMKKGGVELLGYKPDDINAVYLKNKPEGNPQDKRPIAIYFDGFKDNALPIRKGHYNSQCECIVFPASCKDTDWILFVETKYANNMALAFKKELGYPRKMVNQIIETVKYFRDKGIIATNRKVHAIVSFPNLIAAFNSFVFTEEGQSETDIFLNHKIIVRATNSATIISEKRIKPNPV